jgi:hypothetical protein
MCFGAATWSIVNGYSCSAPSDGSAGGPGTGPGRSSDAVPEFENPSLQALRREVNDDRVVDHFVADFLELLDDRLIGLARLLSSRQNEDAVTALLTIETSSLMVGANLLADTAATLRRTVTAGDTAQVPVQFDQLRTATERAKAMLTGR